MYFVSLGEKNKCFVKNKKLVLFNIFFLENGSFLLITIDPTLRN